MELFTLVLSTAIKSIQRKLHIQHATAIM